MRLDDRLDELVGAFEGHAMEATAAQVLVAKRLRDLGWAR